MAKEKPTYENNEIARYGVTGAPYVPKCCILPDGVDPREDIQWPRTYVVLMCDSCGRRTGERRRCKINHYATGTGTGGDSWVVMYPGPRVK